MLAPTPDNTLEAAERGFRDVYVGRRWRPTRVFDRLALLAGAEIPGPAILEQPDATTFIEPELIGRVDRFGNVLIGRRCS